MPDISYKFSKGSSISPPPGRKELNAPLASTRAPLYRSDAPPSRRGSGIFSARARVEPAEESRAAVTKPKSKRRHKEEEYIPPSEKQPRAEAQLWSCIPYPFCDAVYPSIGITIDEIDFFVSRCVDQKSSLAEGTVLVGKDNDNKPITEKTANKELFKLILHTIVLEAEGMSKVDPRLFDLMKRLITLEEVKQMVLHDHEISDLIKYGLNAVQLGKKVLYYFKQEPVDICETLQTTLNNIHPRFSALKTRILGIKRHIESCKKGAAFHKAFKADPDAKCEALENKFVKLTRALTFEKKYCESLKSPEDTLIDTLEMIIMAAEFGVPEVLLHREGRGESDVVLEETEENKNILDHLLELAEVREMLEENAKNAVGEILRQKIREAREAIAKGKASGQLHLFMSIPRIIVEVLSGNGVLAGQLIMSHHFNARLHKLIGLLIDEAKYIQHIGLDQGRQKMMLLNIITFFTRYVEGGESIPIARAKQRKLRKELMDFCSDLRKILKGEFDDSLRTLETVILKSPIARAQKLDKERHQEIIDGLQKNDLDQYFKPAIKFLAQAHKCGNRNLAVSMCQALENAVITRLRTDQVGLTDFEYGVKLLAKATRLSIYVKDEAQNRLKSLQEALLKAAPQLMGAVPYEIKSGKQLYADVVAIYNLLFTKVKLGELDGCLWGKAGKEYLTPNIDAYTQWHTDMSNFLIDQLFLRLETDDDKRIMRCIIDAAALALENRHYGVYDCLMGAITCSNLTRLDIEAPFKTSNNYKRITEALDLNPIVGESYDRTIQIAEIQGDTAYPILRLFLGKIEFATQNIDLSLQQVSLDNLTTFTRLKNRLWFYISNLKTRPKKEIQADKERARMPLLAITVAKWSGRLDEEQFEKLSNERKPEVKGEFKTKFGVDD